jgi:hypothetical protein
MKDSRSILMITLALCVAITASAFIAYFRIQAEKDNMTIELSADYGDIERLSALSARPIDKVLLEMKNAGIVSVAITEDLAQGPDINFLANIDPKKLNLYIENKGLNLKKIAVVEKSGLRVIPRIRNSFNLNSNTIKDKVREISRFGTVIFAEEEVLGYPSYLKETARALRSNNIKYGFIEFGKQLGDNVLSSGMGLNVIKVHSIPQEEMENLSVKEMKERFLRAVRERGIRALYVHTLQYPESGMELLDTNTAFISDLKSSLIKGGYSIGEASSPKGSATGAFARMLIGLGVASGVILLLAYFVEINYFLVIAMLIFIAAIPSTKILALLSTIVFPSYAVISQFPAKKEDIVNSFISVPIVMVMSIAAITGLGAMFTAALLTSPSYMLGASTFSGVKLAFIMPILIISGYFFLRDEQGSLKIKKMYPKIKELLNMNIKVLHVALLLIAAVAGAILILRSGNFGLPVPGVEKAARGALENALLIRPRTKEFLIGYPALIIASIYYLRGGNAWLWLMLAIGALAPISLTNSFCHIHTPLMITAIRSVMGLVLGIAVGLLAYLVYFLSDKAIQRYIK